MSSRVTRNFQFQSAVYFSGDFFVNSYDIDIQFTVETESIREQNIALERIKYFIHRCLEHSIFIYEQEHSVIEKYLDADLKICTLPEEPYDQIIGIMLLNKLNAITEGRLVATEVITSSRMSDGVKCVHEIDESVGPFKFPNWWNENNTKIAQYFPKGKNKKVVKLVKFTPEWDELGLTWEEKPLIQTIPHDSEVVFASFDNKSSK